MVSRGDCRSSMNLPNVKRPLLNRLECGGSSNSESLPSPPHEEVLRGFYTKTVAKGQGTTVTLKQTESTVENAYAIWKPLLAMIDHS